MPVIHARLVQSACVMALLLSSAAGAPALAQDGEEAASEAQAAPANIEMRLRRIEDNLIDMRAMIGALQSFAPGNGSASAPTDSMPDANFSGDPFAQRQDPLAQREDTFAQSTPQPSGGPSPDLQQLEIQVQALSAQLSETVKRLNRLEASLGGANTAESEAGREPFAESEGDDMFAQDPEPDAATGFGTTTVEPPVAPEDDFGSWEQEAMSAPGDEAGNSDAQALFTQGYDALQVQDYAAARDSFQTFLDSYPDDPLANDARYWLADAAFAEGDYVIAANNFVRVYNTAPTGEKSEETLLKLAVVLRRLDRAESACDALGRLDGRLDTMPESFRTQVADERRRSGCQ